MPKSKASDDELVEYSKNIPENYEKIAFLKQFTQEHKKWEKER